MKVVEQHKYHDLVEINPVCIKIQIENKEDYQFFVAWADEKVAINKNIGIINDGIDKANMEIYRKHDQEWKMLPWYTRLTSTQRYPKALDHEPYSDNLRDLIIDNYKFTNIRLNDFDEDFATIVKAGYQQWYTGYNRDELVWAKPSCPPYVGKESTIEYDTISLHSIT